MKSASVDYAVTDGTRPMGRIVSKGDQFEPSLPGGRRLELCKTVREAQQAIFKADVDQRELDRLADDGGRPD